MEPRQTVADSDELRVPRRHFAPDVLVSSLNPRSSASIELPAMANDDDGTSSADRIRATLLVLIGIALLVYSGA